MRFRRECEHNVRADGRTKALRAFARRSGGSAWKLSAATG